MPARNRTGPAPVPVADTQSSPAALAAARVEPPPAEPPPAESRPAPRYLTVAQWPRYHDWPPEGGLRHLIFHADSSGFATAFKRVGRRVVIDTAEFWRIVANQGDAR